MAAVTYTVKRGDSLWKICASSEWGPKISGNNTQAKINTLVSLNNIPNANLIYPGQVLTLSGSGGSSDSSSTTTPSNCVSIDILSLKADSDSGRDVFAYWTWSRDKTKGFKIRWEYDTLVDGKAQTQYTESETSDPGITYAEFSVPESVIHLNNWVQVFITPISEFTKDAEGNDTKYTYWTADETGKQYFFKDNPPKTPESPTCEINASEPTTLTMKLEDIEKTTDIASVIFQVIKDNKSAIYTSSPIAVTEVTGTEFLTVSHQYTVSLGSSYKVRAKGVGSNGKESGWSEFSDDVKTIPSPPSEITTCVLNRYTDNGQYVYVANLKWTSVPNADSYIVEYTTSENNFDTTAGCESVQTDDNRPEISIAGLTLGNTYYFRVRTVSGDLTSDPSGVVSLPTGVAPAAPTTWSSANSTFVGDDMDLNWIHNTIDGSAQTYAQISLTIGEGEDAITASHTFENTTDSTTGEREDTDTSWMYGTCVSYKGDMYFKMDTKHVDFTNKKVNWKVRTSGVTGVATNGVLQEDTLSPWSIERTVTIYEKPALEMSMTKDALGNTGMITILDSFPFYVNADVTIDKESYDIQRPIGYNVRILSNEYYVTVDDTGTSKTINKGDAVYFKNIDLDVSEKMLDLELSANDVDLESGISYTLYCTVDMSTGLTITATHEFAVSWIDDISYEIRSSITIDKNSYSATIRPYCISMEDGKLVDNITLSVYRREYDGTYTKVASGIPNTNTYVMDPHPALDYARYRIVAKDSTTGAIAYYDPPAEPIKATSIIVQWGDPLFRFDITGEYTSEGPYWSGSIVKLPYNVDVTDSREREVKFAEYIGRERPVTYYGTKITESPSWSGVIPKDDLETIYALRRLSIWAGDVYIREPSGMGYWANVRVSFNKNHKDVTIPVTLNITRVEGGL